MALKANVNCNICTENISKYKCPNCEVPYCSLNCWKVHKESPCEKKDLIKSPEKLIEKRELNFPTDDTIAPELLDELKSSENLKKLLENPHLRRYISEVDAAPNAWTATKAAMMEPLFIEFADECLKIVDKTTNDSDLLI